MESIRGTVLKFLGSREPGRANAFALVRYESAGGLVEAKVGGPFGSAMREGDWFIAEGAWDNKLYRGKWEEQFKAKKVRPDLPVTRAGATDLLQKTFNAASHGIPAAAAKAFVDRHGPEILRRVEGDPKLLFEASSAADVHGPAILRDWGRRNSGRQAVNLLEAAGIGERSIQAIIEAYRDDAHAVMRADPYKIARLKEISFEEADRLGSFLKVASDDPRRIRAGVADVLRSTAGGGHTYTPLSEMGEGLRRNGIDAAALRALVAGSASDGDEELVFDRVDGEPVVQRKSLFMAEQFIALAVARMLRHGRAADRSRIDEVSERVLALPKYSRLDPVQRAAVLSSVCEAVAILSGGPGTGKSTVSEAIADIAELTITGPVILLAPTGKAAVRLAEATGREADTVHRVLQARPDVGAMTYGRNRHNKLPDNCFVLVDESSMLDAEVTAALLDAMPESGRVLFVGDRYQLPSVCEGYVLGDMVRAVAPDGSRVPYAELIKNYRSAEKAGIGNGAEMIKRGEVPPLDNKLRGGVVLFEHKTPEIVSRVSGLVRGALRKQFGLDPVRDVIVLCPQAPGPAGTWEMNARLSAELNPDGARIEGVEHGRWDDPKLPLPRVGDRVILTKNDKDLDVTNGEVGFLVAAETRKAGNGRESRVLVVEIDGGQRVDVPLARWRELSLAYAITGHKSQGSQYPCVIMPMTMAHAKMHERTLFYTEWTRAKEMVIVVGEREAIDLAVETVSATQRRTRLRAFLEQSLAGLSPAPAPAPEPAAARPGKGFSGLRGGVRPAPAQAAAGEGPETPPRPAFSGLRGGGGRAATQAAPPAPGPAQPPVFSGLRGGARAAPPAAPPAPARGGFSGLRAVSRRAAPREEPEEAPAPYPSP